MKINFVLPILIFLIVSANAYGQEAATVVEQGSNNNVELKLWISAIGLLSGLLGAYVSHVFSYRRELRLAESHRKTELKSVASVLLSEIRYHKKMVKGRVEEIEKYKSVKNIPSRYLSTINFSEPEVYKEYMGNLAHLGSVITGQLIRFHGTTHGFNKIVEYCINSELEVNKELLDSLLKQLSNVEIRANSCIKLLSKYIDGKGASIEEQNKIEAEIYDG